MFEFLPLTAVVPDSYLHLYTSLPMKVYRMKLKFTNSSAHKKYFQLNTERKYNY